MKKFNVKKIKLSQESLHQASGAVIRWFKRLPSYLLIDRLRVFGATLLVLGVLLSILLVSYSLYLKQPKAPLTEARRPELSGGALDIIIEWIDQNEAARGQAYVLPGSQLFQIENPEE